MRSSSVKTLVATLLVVATMTFATPAANAGPAQKRDTITIGARNEPRGIDRIGRAVRRFISRFTGGFTTTNWPSIPPDQKPDGQ